MKIATIFCRLFSLPFYLIAGSEVFRKIQPVYDAIDEDFSVLKCAKNIGETYFLQPQNVEIISRAGLSGFEKFAKVFRNSSEFRYSDNRKTLTKYGAIFLEGKDHEDDFKRLKILARFDPQGRFILAIKTSVDSYAKKIVSYLASIEKWNVVIISKETGSGRTRLQTLTTHYSSNCSSKIPRLVDLGVCEDSETLKKLFPSFLDHKKCPVLLSIVNYPPYAIIREENGENRVTGIEGNLMEIILKKLNATWKIYKESTGTALRDNVKKRKTDLSIGSMLQFQIHGTTWTQSYLFADTVIVVPQSLFMPFWMNLILPFQTEVWAALGVLISVLLGIQLTIPSFRRQFHVEWMFSGFFGTAIGKLPRKLSQRLYLALWMFSGYIAMQSYSAGLTGFFASPGQYKPMQTINELEKSRVVVGGLKVWRNQFEQSYPRIYRDWKVFSEPQYFENLVKLREKRGGIASHGPMRQILNVTRGQESSFVVIQEQLIFCTVAILLPNSSAILEGSNRVILRVFQAGFIQFWENSFTREMGSVFTSREEKGGKKKSLVYFEAPFFILIVGNCASLVVFTVEIVLAKLRK